MYNDSDHTTILLYCHYTGAYVCFAFYFLLFHLKQDDVEGKHKEHLLQNSSDHCCLFDTSFMGQ